MQFKDTCDDMHLTKLSFTNSEKLSDELKRSLNKIAQQEGYKSYKIINRTITTDGGNFLAGLYEIDIKGELDDEEKETNVFVKQAISQANIKILEVSEMYSKELFFYGDLSKLFVELENEASVPQYDRYKSAKFYNESTTDAIILQNLSKEGYRTMHRLTVMPLKFAEMSIQQLAKFHAMSFVIEKKRPEYFESKIKTLKSSIIFCDDFDKYCKEIYKTSVAGLDYENKKKMEENFFEYLEYYKKYVNSDHSTIRCLCHGDYRMNNVLMKILKETIDEVILIDFQMLYYGSPMTDFMYFIFSATDKKFRKSHLEYLKNLYFDTMERFLHYFAIDINSAYPRKQFEIDYDDSLKYGLYVMLFVMPFPFTLEGDAPDLDNNDLFDIKFQVDKIYYDRLTDTIDDMIEYGKL